MKQGLQQTTERYEVSVFKSHKICRKSAKVSCLISDRKPNVS